jgi:flagellar biosynthesis/type III secretory pathway M-ring protein FliF/YscJ
MIQTINLSYPRKKVQNIYNDLFFQVKFKKILIKRNKKSNMVFAIILAHLIILATFAGTKSSKNTVDQLIKETGYPTIDAIFQMMKMGNLAYTHVD